MNFLSFVRHHIVAMFLFSISAASAEILPKTPCSEALENDGFFVISPEMNALSQEEKDELIPLFVTMTTNGPKCAPGSSGVSHLYVALFHNGEFEKLCLSQGACRVVSFPTAIKAYGSRVLRQLSLDSDRSLVEACLVDNFKLKSLENYSWRMSWHRDECAGSCHPYIGVIALELHNVSEHSFLLGCSPNKNGPTALPPDEDMPVSKAISVEPGAGYWVNEEHPARLFHATTFIECGLGRSSRKMLILRICNKKTHPDKYLNMVEFYKTRSGFTE